MEHVLTGSKVHVPLNEISLGKQIYQSCVDATPQEVIYIDAVSGQRTTYKHFFSQCCRLARALQNCGYKQNDVVAVSSENNNLFCVPVVASLFSGIISAALNHTYSHGELAHLIEITKPKIIFCSRKVLNVYTLQKQQSIERIVVLEDEEVEGFDTLRQFTDKYCERNFCVDSFQPVDVDPLNQVAVILCSSGTSGMPKGVMITHDNISMRVNQLYDPKLNLTHHETLCAVVPYFHACGMMMNLASMVKRNTIVFLRRFEENLFLKTIEKYKVNNTTIVPTIAYMLIKGGLLKEYDLSSMEEIFCAGAPLSPEVETKLVGSFPNMRTLRQGYGLTETTFTIVLTPTGGRKTGSSGKTVSDTLIYIRDIETGKMLGANQNGEICVKSRLVSKGYYNNPEETKASYKDGWFFTGDIGYYDDEGYVFIVDRIKELIKYKGFQVPPAEVEAVLLSHPKIKNASVVGKPDDIAGELPTAFVVKEALSNISEDDVIKFVASRISKPKQLHGGVYFVDDLPKTANGKVQRRALRSMFAQDTYRI